MARDVIGAEIPSPSPSSFSSACRLGQRSLPVEVRGGRGGAAHRTCSPQPGQKPASAGTSCLQKGQGGTKSKLVAVQRRVKLRSSRPKMSFLGGRRRRELQKWQSAS